MSEYQYYEFRALDGKLSKADQTYLRSISSRGEVTSDSFTNEYEWGDFKGDPLKLMQRCFDLHVYYANWGTRTLMLKVPESSLPRRDANLYACESLELAYAGESTVVTFNRSPDDWDDSFDAYGNRDWAGQLAPIRELLLAGDLRPLYLGWLAGIPDRGEEETKEPPVPAGLQQLPRCLEVLVKYLGIDRDLLTIAASPSPPAPPVAAKTANESDASAVDPAAAAWVTSLPAAEKDAALLRVLSGEGAGVRTSLLAQFRQLKGAAYPTVLVDRTEGILYRGAEALTVERKNVEAQLREQEKARRQKKAAAERQVRLEALAQNPDQTWQRLEPMVAAGATQYPEVVSLLKDLRDAATLANRTFEHNQRLTAFIEKVRRKSSLMKQIRGAKLLPTEPRAA